MAPRAATEWFRKHAETTGLGPERLAQAELCLDELVTNVVRYGGGREAQPVTLTVSFRRGTGEFLLVVEDNGCIFDPQGVPEPVFASILDHAPAGGRGVSLIRSLVDELHYERDNGRNRVTLVFRREGPIMEDR